MWTKDEPQGRVLQKAFKCFQEKTGVKVDVQWLGRKAYTQNLVPALNTGTGSMVLLPRPVKKAFWK